MILEKCVKCDITNMFCYNDKDLLVFHVQPLEFWKFCTSTNMFVQLYMGGLRTMTIYSQMYLLSKLITTLHVPTFLK